MRRTRRWRARRARSRPHRSGAGSPPSMPPAATGSAPSPPAPAPSSRRGRDSRPPAAIRPARSGRSPSSNTASSSNNRSAEHRPRVVAAHVHRLLQPADAGARTQCACRHVSVFPGYGIDIECRGASSAAPRAIVEESLSARAALRAWRTKRRSTRRACGAARDLRRIASGSGPRAASASRRART